MGDMERARELVADCAKRGVQGHEAISRRNQARVLAIAAAGLALRKAALTPLDGSANGLRGRILAESSVAAFDAAIAKAVAKGGG